MAHYVIMGCGRVGSSLALTLERAGHSVAVVDQDEHAFRRLGRHFGGQRVTGVGFDRDALTRARVQDAYAFAAVSSGDNSNIIAARVARETFGVEHVVARIYDPGRAEIYQRLGIPTVAAVRWSTDQVLRRILPDTDLAGDFRDSSGRIVMAEVHVSPDWIGRPLTELESRARVRIAFVTRFGEGIVPGPETLYQQGDILHAVMDVAGQDEAERVLAAGPGLEAGPDVQDDPDGDRS
ncbi:MULTISPECIES: potassium channel family protein [Citricoccus]|uniref:potassium channel family protein n=1 Tax=Citricoccus TaxID=169133 RepID=UPI000255DE7B|nr:TrkA family potassium uptake protein [Citricoccus sp. CH26A]